MTNQSSIAVGDVVLVNIPFSDGVGAKRRPALVIGPRDGYGDHLMLAITSNPETMGGIELDGATLQQGSLPRPSWVKPLAAHAVAAARVERVLAKVKPALLTKVRATLCPALGCA